MFSPAQEGDYVTHTFLAVGCAQDVVDAGHDGGDVGDVATVIHGSLDLIVASKSLLESAAGPWAGLGWVEGAADGSDEQGDFHGDFEDQ